MRWVISPNMMTMLLPLLFTISFMLISISPPSMEPSETRILASPIRLFLSGYDMTPTMRDVNKKFSVRYYLNLVLVDEEERR